MRTTYYVALCYLFCHVQTLAQDIRRYVEPQYRVVLHDTAGTFIQVQNYYNRQYYTEDLYCNQPKGDMNYTTTLLVHPLNGLAKADKLAGHLVDIHIQKTFVLHNVSITQDKINRIDIWDEHGFLSIPLLAASRKDTGRIKVEIRSSEDTLFETIPCIMAMPKGRYELLIHNLPQKSYTYYAHPSEIKTYYFNEPILCQFKNVENFHNATLLVKDYKLQSFVPIIKNLPLSTDSSLQLLPKHVYQVEFQKKNRKKLYHTFFYPKPQFEIYYIDLKQH